MKTKNTTFYIFLLLAFSLIAVNANAQSNTCDCWQPLDTGFHAVPFHRSTPPFYRNDDDWTDSIALPFSFCFYGTSVNQILIDNNGYITWGARGSELVRVDSTYDPQISFPNITVPMIAPFWSDEETDIGSNSYRTNMVWYKITPTHLIIQWDSVGFYSSHFGLENTFQLIVTNGSDPIVPYGNNIEFCYKDMQWAVGDDQQGNSGFDSPNSPALVGINEGNGIGNIQFGLFDTPTANYAGSYPSPPAYDGVYWLDNKQLLLNSCTNEAPPLVTGISPCDTFKICVGNTMAIPMKFTTVFQGASVNSLLTPPVLSGVSMPYNQSAGQSDSVVVQVTGNVSNVGYHIVGVTAYDNRSPADTLFATFVIDVLPAANYTISAVPDTICAGNSTVLTATGGATYNWSPGGATTSSVTVSPASTTTYSVSINGCGSKDTSIQVVVEAPATLIVNPSNTGFCSGNSVTLNASGTVTSYSWAPATGLSCTSCASPTASPAVKTIYTVTGSANGCTITATDTVNVYPNPVVVVSPSADTICGNASATLTASGASAYVWAPGNGTGSSITVTPASSTVYTVIGTSIQGCTNAATLPVVVEPLPSVSLPPNMDICPGRSVSLIATGNGDSYTWMPGNESGPIITVSPTSTETWTVTMENGCGTVTANITVTVNPQPVPAFKADVLSGCSPLCIQFRDNSTISSGTITEYTWDFGTGDTTHTRNPIYCYKGPGSYPVKITTTSDSGCSSELSVSNYITVYSSPNAAFSTSPDPVNILEPTVSFTDKSTDAYRLAEWVWNFGDNIDTIDMSENTSHTYRDTGRYCVRLVVMNVHGCTDSVINCLDVEPLYTLYIPDAFTPNGNGVNDVFIPKGNDIKSFEMYIFDRWGVQVFHSTDISDGWNGTVNGNGAVCQEDTYVYLITVHDSKNRRHTYTGTLSLLK